MQGTLTGYVLVILSISEGSQTKENHSRDPSLALRMTEWVFRIIERALRMTGNMLTLTEKANKED